MWDWKLALETLPKLWQGFLTTVQVSILASIGAVILGLIWAVIRYVEVPFLSGAVSIFVQLLRGTPLLVQLYILFYVVPQYGISASAFMTGVVGMSFYFSSYCAEVFRAGIINIPKGQWDVARALSLPPRRVWLDIILPQVGRSVIPPIGNYAIVIFKQSALLSTITVAELLHSAQNIGSETYRYVEPITMAGLLYFAISYPAALGLRRLEKRLATR